MSDLLTVDAGVAFLTLTVMEVVLGIDNVVFIAILAGKLPVAQQARARRLGLVLALGSRLALLGAIRWVMGLTADLFEVSGHGFSGRDLILLGGGLFLVGKATREIHEKLEGDPHDPLARPVVSFGAVLAQIVLLDVVFSLDSVITAVGMAQQLPVMVAAVVVAVLVMLACAGAISGFIERHPSLKILALSFLLLIGVVLMADGMGQHVGKGYVYSAMAFSVFIELLNMRYRARRAPVALHGPFDTPPGGVG